MSRSRATKPVKVIQCSKLLCNNISVFLALEAGFMTVSLGKVQIVLSSMEMAVS